MSRFTEDRPVERVEQLGESWKQIDLAAVLDGDLTSPSPTVLAIDVLPRRHLFYPGTINGIHGDSGIGKSWVSAIAMAQEIRAGRNVMLIDYEDTPQTLCSRLLALLVPAGVIAAHVDYRRPSEMAVTPAVAELVGAITNNRIGLVVVDSLGEAFGVEGIDENSDAEVGPFLREVIRPLADAGAAVVIIDHSTKAKDNPLYPSGSKRKRAAITGASYYVTSDRPPVRPDGMDPTEGKLRITCAKDRHGTYRQGDVVASITITSYPDDSVIAHVWPPDVIGTAELSILLCARAAVRAAEKIGRSVPQIELVGLMELKARTESKVAGIMHAVGEGYLDETKGPRNSRQFSFKRKMEVSERP